MPRKKLEPDTPQNDAHLAFVNFMVLIDFVDTLPEPDQCRFYDLLQEYRRTVDHDDRSKFNSIVREIFGDVEDE